MKKEKLFKIGVVNKSTVDVVNDTTTFYTSDTELWLGFELSEEGVEFDSAEILMFNIDDKSFIVRSVVKTDDKYWYELDMDMIAHHGQWKVQLQFTKNNEVYTSKYFNIRIENDLSNERPPKLIDIGNWSNIKQTADSLIAEMKVAVTEAIAAEQNRAEIFAQAESERQTIFETAESERNQTFESNEAIRQTQELEREKAEAERQITFDDNEGNRTETFNTNEATRQENETTRQQAESQRQSTFETNESERQTTFEDAEQSRQSAELIRVENEILRVERDVNRELEIDEIKNNVVYFSGVKLNNLVVNGDFKDRLTKWVTVNNAVVSVTSEGVEILSTKNGLQLHQGVSVPTNDVLYSAVAVKTDTPTNFVYATNQKVVPINSSSQDFHLLSSLETRLNYPYLSINAINSDGTPKKLTLKYMIAINLTAVFGAGNEPSKEIMDWIVKGNGYFNELTIRRDDIQQYEINQLRKAVIALGGTV